MKTVLITGVAGFMGSHIADSFLDNGFDVKGIDNLIGGYKSNIPSKVDFLEADLGDLEAIQDFFVNVDLVVHTACTAYEGLSVFSPALVTRNTFHITATALSASVSAGVSKFVYLSSMARYGEQEVVPFVETQQPKPQDPYGIAKYSSELLVRNVSETHGMDFVILVPHNIIGPRQKYDDPFRNVASIMINRMLQGKQPIIYGDGNQKRCFSFMRDVTEPIMLACSSEIANGAVINIGPDDEFITINQLATEIAKLLEFELDAIYVPGRPQEVKDANCSANLARNLLDYKPKTSLVDGLLELATWIKSEGPRDFDYKLPIEIISDKTPRTWTQRLI
jgi:UDP-glucose 4-epimerase